MEVSNKYIIYPQKKRGRPERWMPTAEGRFKCELCEKEYKDKSGIKQHTSLKHAQDRRAIELLQAKDRTEALLIQTLQEYVDFTIHHCNEYAHACNERANSLKELLNKVSAMRAL